MAETDAARTAAIDQGRAAVDDSIDDLLAGARELLERSDPNEVLLALFEVLKDDEPPACWIAAGALLRIAQQGQP